MVISATDGGTRIVDVFQRYPVRFMFPRVGAAPVAEAVVVNCAGGIVGGDCLDLAVSVQGGAALAVTTQAAEKVYGTLQEMAHVSTVLEVGQGASLAWLPQETILFDRARLRREMHVHLCEGAQFTGLEWIVLGRAAYLEEMTAGLLHDSWRIHIGGQLKWADNFRVVDEQYAQLHRKALLAGFRVFGTMVCFGRGSQASLDVLRDLAPMPDCEFAVTHVGPLAIARFAAHCSATLRAVLRAALSTRIPRMWSC